MDIEPQLKKIIAEQCDSTEPSNSAPIATTVGATQLDKNEALNVDSLKSLGECAADLLPSLDGLVYRICISTPLRLTTAILTIPLIAFLVARVATPFHSDFLSIFTALCLAYLPIALLVAALALVVIFQGEFTFRWARSLERIHTATQFYSGGSYPVLPSRAGLIGFLSSPLLIPLFMMFAFAVAGSWEPTSSHDQISPVLEIGKSVFGLLALLLVSNAATLLTFFSHNQIFGKLIPWMNAVLPEERHVNPNLAFLIPLALVLPATWAIWSYPLPSTLFYLLMTPLATMFAFDRLSQINDALRELMAPHTVRTKRSFTLTYKIDAACLIACIVSVAVFAYLIVNVRLP